MAMSQATSFSTTISGGAMKCRGLSSIVILFILHLTSQSQDNGDGGLATEALLGGPSGIALDQNGNLVFGERRGNRVRRVDLKTGIITTIAGTGVKGFSGDGGPAREAELGGIEHIAFDSKWNLYLGDRGNARVRRIDGRTGIITTLAGNGIRGYSGDGGPATEASITNPYGLTVDSRDNVYIADTENQRIRRVDITTGIITTVAGNGEKGFSGDGGPATNASFYRPHVITMDPAGNLVIGDSFNQRIRRVDSKTGIIMTIAGTGEKGAGGSGGPAIKASFQYFGALVFDTKGDLYFTEGNNRIRKIDHRTNIITLVAGTGEAGFSGDGGPALQATLKWPYGMAIDGEGNIYFADWENNRIRKIAAETGVITTVAGRGE